MHTNSQQVQEHMLHLTNHQGNVNENHSEMSPHPARVTAIIKHKRQQVEDMENNEDVEKKEDKLVNYGKQYRVSFKNLKYNSYVIQQSHN